MDFMTPTNKILAKLGRQRRMKAEMEIDEAEL